MKEQLNGMTWQRSTACGGYTGEDGEACVLVAVVETGGA